MNFVNVRRALAPVFLLALGCVPLHATPWLALGPYGGDARTIAADPHNSEHLFLGTATGFVYESMNNGKEWKRLARVGKRDDLVLDHIIDSLNVKHLLVGAWFVDRPDGGLYESYDGGASWFAQAEMRGQSVRALTVAPSDPRMMVAGTLKGVYRSLDSGKHWSLISPEGNTELHEVESVAVDPRNPAIIFAGTWHLPWKTVDGGAHWLNINEEQGGIHDDSDIFSIIIDPQTPQVVYLSACSGIYKSMNGGNRFERARPEQLGLNHMAIRTRKLAQDPTRPQIVFAGTTEGLWRTTNSAGSWQRMTPASVIVNDVYVDPKNADHVLIATDRAGVLESHDDGVTFQPSNSGFTARQVTSFAGDPRHPAIVYAGIVNDKDSGGVFMSMDGGVHWQQQSTGLSGRDVFSLAVTEDGTVLAGTGHGIFRLASGSWTPSGALPVPAEAKPVAAPRPVASRPAAKPAAGHAAVKGRPAPIRLTPAPPAPIAPTLDAAVYALVSVGDKVYAGTSQGVLQGTQDGRQWTPVSTLQMPETRFLSAQKSTVVVAGLRRISLSLDDAKTWDTVALPAALTQVSSVAVDDMGNLWVGGREGLYYSTDYGLTWKTLRNLYVTNVTGITFDAAGHQVLVTTESSTLTFAAHLPDYKVTYVDTGWDLRFVRPVGNHLIGATPFDGVVVQPVMVDSKVAE